MELYFASTPYNILMSILIKQDRKEKADLIISDFSAQNHDIYQRIKKLDLFEHVYFVHQKQFEDVEMKCGKLKRIFIKLNNRLKNRYGYQKLFKKECSEMSYKEQYDLAFFDTTNYLQRVIFYHYHKNNKKLKFYKVDCGIESYYNSSNTNIKFKKMRDVTRKMMKSYLGTYLIDPRFCLFDNYPTFQINREHLDSKLLNDVFNYQGDDGIFDYQTVYFDQKLDYQEWIDKQIDIVKKCAENNNSFVVKMHPRTDNDIYKTYKIIKSRSTFELMLINSKDCDFDKKVYITPMSTAVFLPKMLLDKEPIIICVMDIMNLHFPEEDAVRQFVKKAKDIYGNDKVFMPSSLDEFSDILLKINRAK